MVISDKVKLFANAKEANNQAMIEIGDKVFIGAGTQLRAGEGVISIQSGSSLGSFCVVDDKLPVTIGADSLLAAYCTIGKSGNSLVSSSDLEDTKMTPGMEIETSVGKGCWLGVRSRILSGASIGEGSIIGTHAVVSNSLPSFIIAVGQPAKVMRKRKPGISDE